MGEFHKSAAFVDAIFSLEGSVTTECGGLTPTLVRADCTDLTYGMMAAMATVIDQTACLYEAMPKRITSIQIQEQPPPSYQNESGLPEPNRTIARLTREPHHEEAKVLVETALGHYNSGKLEEAAEDYNRALELRADSSAALYGLGVVYGQLKQYEESKDAFKSLLRSLENLGAVVDQPLLAAAHQGIGSALLGLWSASSPKEPALEHASEGEFEFREAVALDPNSSGAWVGLGLALHILEKLDDAEAAFRRALEILPDSQVATERLRGVLEDKLERRLFELGYLSRINEPIRDFTPYENRTLIRVEGKPVSEIIVEERR